MTPVAKSECVKALARSLGFDLVGIATAGPVLHAAYYREWIARGYAGTMDYLARNVPLRIDPRELLPGARSVICVAISYRRSDGYVSAASREPRPAGARPTGSVAQYARGRDYHDVLRVRLRALEAGLRRAVDEVFEARVCVDTAPVLEREWAVQAGLGWFGKNTCVLNAELGSYLLLGELVTTLSLEPDAPVADRCAHCTRCLDACPTRAFVAPRQLDASRCISYLTIEHRGPIPEPLHAAVGDRVFGCDVCQQVCPYNARAPLGKDPDLMADLLPARVDLAALVELRAGAYRRMTCGSAARRAGPGLWRRNAAIAMRNDS